MKRLAVVVAAALVLSGCARYEEWQILQKRDEAYATLLAQCKAGDSAACAYIVSGSQGRGL